MELIKALKKQGLNNLEIKETINEIIEDIKKGADINEIIKSYNLNKDFIFDLLILSTELNFKEQ